MSRTFEDLPLNPFEDNVVFEPRDAESAIAGLNDRPLGKLRRAFARLETEPKPRRTRLPLLAQLVVSAEPGYGKSHLIGRLFRELDDRATQIYLRGFQDAETFWQSLLLKVVQEMDRPDDPKLSKWQPGVLSQLDAFAFGVFAHLLSGLILNGKVVCDDAPARAEEFRTKPLEAFGHGKPEHSIYQWMQTEFAARLLPALERELPLQIGPLTGGTRAWLKVLYAYASCARDPRRRGLCLDWLKGDGLSEEEAGALGLAANEVPQLIETARGRETAAQERLRDLSALAGFFRPFLFCFDQIDAFADGPGELAPRFGEVIEALVAHGLNQLVVVAANSTSWRTCLDRMQAAFRARFTEPIELEGIQRAQAEAVIAQRLEGCGLRREELQRFADARWLDQLFAEKTTLSIRSLLRRCAARCDEFAESSGTPVKPSPTVPEKTLDDYFRHHELELRAKGNAPEFDPNVFAWALGPELVGGAFPPHEVARFQHDKHYFPIIWRQPGEATLFGFEDSNNSSRWQAILREAGRQRTARQGREALRFLFLRTCDQRKVPAPTWVKIGAQFLEARAYFSVRQLSPDEYLHVCAAFDFYGSATEGNIEAPAGHTVTAAEALEYLRTRLRPWWESLLQPARAAAPADCTPAPAPPSSELLEEIAAVMQRRLFISLEQLIADLKSPPSSAEVAAACDRHPRIRVFATSRAVALKWT